MKHIIILGASYAGVSTAHRILKHAGKTGAFKVTLVSPNTHFYWNMASPRGLVPGQFTDEQLFEPITSGFSRYPASQFEFILASAESLDVEAKEVVVIEGPDHRRTLSYDFLVISTGSRTKDKSPMKGLGSTEETKYHLHAFQEKVQNAQKIVVAGAGATGVEIAGELASVYGGEKEVILLASEATVLDRTIPSVSNTAMKALLGLNVEIKLQTKVTNVSGAPNGQIEISLSSGDKILADMYIPTFGLVPNSSFIPDRFLNSKGLAIVDSHLNLKGAKAVWAIGDVSEVEPMQFMFCDWQSTYVAKSIISLLNNKTPIPYKVSTSAFMGIQIGRKAGTGHWGSIKLPGFLVARMRKDLFTDWMVPTVNGSKF